KPVTFQTGNGASGVMFWPRFGASPSPSMVSVLSCWMRALPPRASAASLIACNSGAGRAQPPNRIERQIIWMVVFIGLEYSLFGGTKYANQRAPRVHRRNDCVIRSERRECAKPHNHQRADP